MKSDIKFGFVVKDERYGQLQVSEARRPIGGKLGDERFLKLPDVPDRMRAHFEADPEDSTQPYRGKQNLLKQKVRKS